MHQKARVTDCVWRMQSSDDYTSFCDQEQEVAGYVLVFMIVGVKNNITHLDTFPPRMQRPLPPSLDGCCFGGTSLPKSMFQLLACFVISFSHFQLQIRLALR